MQCYETDLITNQDREKVRTVKPDSKLTNMNFYLSALK